MFLLFFRAIAITSTHQKAADFLKYMCEFSQS